MKFGFPNIIKSHWPAGLIIFAFLALSVIYSVVNPLFEALDEVWHYPFVWHLARTWELPVQDPANVQLWRQEASQPPLYYALAALLTAPIPADDLPALIYRNPHADLGIVTADGNINMIVHTYREQWPWQGAVLAAHLARLVSVLISTGTVITIYALGRTLWSEKESFALLAMSFVAFNPMFIFVSASVNNDNLVTLLASLVIWRLVVLVPPSIPPKEGEAATFPSRGRAYTTPPTLWHFVLLGALIGLAALSKLSGVGLLGLTGLTLLWLGWRQRSWRTAILGNVIVVLVAGAIAGWWYWRNLGLYGEWSGTEIMVQMMGPRAITPTAGQLLAEVPGMMRSFWGLFGGLSVAMPPAVYWLLNAMLMVGLGGLIMAMVMHRTKKLPPGLNQSWPILAGWLILLIIGLVQWTLRTPATQGRLLFPGLAALAPLWAAGWMALVPARWHWLPAAGLFALAVWAPWGLILPAYAQPTPVHTLPDSAQRLEVDFGDSIRLLAYHLPATETTRPGDAIPLTLYWRGDKPLDTDYSVFIHLLDEQGVIIAQRDTFHGLGLYPTSQWQANTQFADSYTLHIPRTAFAPATAHFGVGLYDRNSGQRLPASTGGDTARFGQISLQPPPGLAPNPQDLRFEDGISLAGYMLDKRRVQSGDTINLTLYWQSEEIPGHNYKIFVHLVAEGDARAAQHDSEPQNGLAPTSTWQPGHIITDEHPLTIGPDAPPGIYRLKVGLYDGDSGRRLRLLQNNGVSVQSDSVMLGGVRVNLP